MRYIIYFLHNPHYFSSNRKNDTRLYSQLWWKNNLLEKILYTVCTMYIYHEQINLQTNLTQLLQSLNSSSLKCWFPWSPFLAHSQLKSYRCAKCYWLPKLAIWLPHWCIAIFIHFFPHTSFMLLLSHTFSFLFSAIFICFNFFSCFFSAFNFLRCSLTAARSWTSNENCKCPLSPSVMVSCVSVIVRPTMYCWNSSSFVINSKASSQVSCSKIFRGTFTCCKSLLGTCKNKLGY